MSDEIALPKPVTVTGSAHKNLADLCRKWTGWKDMSITFGDVGHPASDIAMTNLKTHAMTVNINRLLRHPSRRLATVTPHRLRQEAILTGTLLHECGHARFTRWRQPLIDGKPLLHTNGDEVTKATLSLASTLDEPRIEARMLAEAHTVGTAGLSWTMRASAHALLPPTPEGLTLDQQVLNAVQSYVLRAGRCYAQQHVLGSAGIRWAVPSWATDLRTRLVGVLAMHFDMLELQGALLAPASSSRSVMKKIERAICLNDDSSPQILDIARDILEALFPETPGASMPTIVMVCQTGEEDQEKPEPSEGEGEGEGEEESDEKDEPGSSNLTHALEDFEEQEGEADEAEESTTPQDKPGDVAPEVPAPGKPEEIEGPEEESRSTRITAGGGDSRFPWGGTASTPTPKQRLLRKDAGRVLAEVINPVETSVLSLSDAPSAQVDGAAMSAWRASGGTKDPRFFRRTQRQVTPAPPVEVAVLVDVSSSMEDMQKPSALLSWVLASAALDLRNFAGRGQQVRSTLIHWGNEARVIQRPGEPLDSIYTVPCKEGTTAQLDALALVDQQIPGFFRASPDGSPRNRLLIQFTDWEIFGPTAGAVVPTIAAASHTGMQMLSIVPPDTLKWGSGLSYVSEFYKHMAPGTNHLLPYDPKRMTAEDVVAAVAKQLRG